MVICRENYLVAIFKVDQDFPKPDLDPFNASAPAISNDNFSFNWIENALNKRWEKSYVIGAFGPQANPHDVGTPPIDPRLQISPSADSSSIRPTIERSEIGAIRTP